MDMNKKMIRIAKELSSLWGRYIAEYEEDGNTTDNFVYIKNDVSGFIMCCAIDIETLKKEVRFLK